jgi:hypothetical protein
VLLPAVRTTSGQVRSDAIDAVKTGGAGLLSLNARARLLVGRQGEAPLAPFKVVLPSALVTRLRGKLGQKASHPGRGRSALPRAGPVGEANRRRDNPRPAHGRVSKA